MELLGSGLITRPAGIMKINIEIAIEIIHYLCVILIDTYNIYTYIDICKILEYRATMTRMGLDIELFIEYYIPPVIFDVRQSFPILRITKMYQQKYLNWLSLILTLLLHCLKITLIYHHKSCH